MTDAPTREERDGARKDDVATSNGIILPAPSNSTEQINLSSGRTDEAVAFLEAWWPGGPWILTSIGPDGGRTTTATFLGSEVEALRRWIDRRQGKENLYFTVNRTFQAVDSKPCKADMATAVALHVDIDPRAGEELGSERARALKLLREFKPSPTVIIDSGGGFQGFWVLDVPCDLAGDPADERRHLPVEERNIAIEVALQADSCHNIDRIMRLPGTINVPGVKKRAKGRQPALARIVAADWQLRYRLEDFFRAESAPAVEGTRVASRVALPDNLPKLGSLDDLPAEVSHRTKMLIVNGHDPDDPGRYPSRSEVVFAVLCELVRAGVVDEVIASLILDPDYGISAHVLEQPRSRQYAERQIKRARDEAYEPEMADLNTRHVVLLNEQGRTRVLEFVKAVVNRQTRNTVTLQTFDDFRNRYMNRPVVVATDKDGNPVKKPLGATWLAWPHRRQNHSLVFAPGEGDEVGEQLNLWRGFGVAPSPGDWSRMRGHVTDILAGGDREAADYIIRWAAFAVQNPADPAEVALVFRGKKGTGKGIFARALMQLFGQHGLHVPSGKLLTGNFNLHLRDCCLLFADEVEWHGDRQAEATLKVMVTEPELMIEGKGRDAFQSANHLHIVMSSNEDWVVPASIDERRFAAFGVSDRRQGDKAYFTELAAEMDGGGLAAMLHDLLAMNLDGWHPRWSIPQTKELMAQKLASLNGAAAVVHEILMRGETPKVERDIGRLPTIHDGDRVFIPTGDLVGWALARRLINEAKPGLSERIAHELARAAPADAAPVRETVQGLQVRGRWLPALPEARRLWAESRGLAIDWGEGDDAAWDVVRGVWAASDRDMPF